MSLSRVEFGEVRWSLVNGGANEERAERIARLAFEFVRELLSQDLRRLEASVSLDEVRVHPIHVSLETMDDEMIARASAAEIHRALVNALGG